MVPNTQSQRARMSLTDHTDHTRSTLSLAAMILWPARTHLALMSDGCHQAKVTLLGQQQQDSVAV
jgi:hypothetical protein